MIFDRAKMPTVWRNAARDGCLSKNIEIDQNDRMGICHGFQNSHVFSTHGLPNDSCLENLRSFHMGEEILT